MRKCDPDIQARVVLLEEQHRHLVEVVKLMFENTSANNKISQSEVLRRLELLNGEAGRLSSMQATYLPREMYEQNQLRIADNFAQNRRAIFIAIASAIGSLILLVANWLLKVK